MESDANFFLNKLSAIVFEILRKNKKNDFVKLLTTAYLVSLVFIISHFSSENNFNDVS